jgi:hypothetical protein
MLKVNAIETYLTNLCNHLNNNPISFNNEGDGRIESALLEKTVLKSIKEYYENFKFGDFILKDGEDRNWYDFVFESNCETEANDLIPINIKITKLSKSADNLNSKEGIFFALTGINPKNQNISTRNWNKYFENLSETINFNISNAYDYYFIVLKKEANTLINAFWTSLKRLNQIKANGNNLPFQAIWFENQTRTTRDSHDSIIFLIGKFLESLQKRALVSNNAIKECRKIINTVTSKKQ